MNDIAHSKIELTTLDTGGGCMVDFVFFTKNMAVISEEGIAIIDTVGLEDPIETFFDNTDDYANSHWWYANYDLDTEREPLGGHAFVTGIGPGYFDVSGMRFQVNEKYSYLKLLILKD